MTAGTLSIDPCKTYLSVTGKAENLNPDIVGHPGNTLVFTKK